MSFHANLDSWTKVGAKTNFNDIVFTINDDLSICQHTLSELIDEYKDKVNTPMGIQDQFFVENNLIKEWSFGEQRKLFEFDSHEEAKNALKGLMLYSLHTSEIAPRWYDTKEKAHVAIMEISTEAEISDILVNNEQQEVIEELGR